MMYGTNANQLPSRHEQEWTQLVDEGEYAAAKPLEKARAAELGGKVLLLPYVTPESHIVLSID